MVSKRSASPFRDAFSRASLVSAKPGRRRHRRGRGADGTVNDTPGPVPEKTPASDHSNGTLRASGGVYPSRDEPGSFATCAMRKVERSNRERWHLQTPPLSVHVRPACSIMPSTRKCRPRQRWRQARPPDRRCRRLSSSQPRRAHTVRYRTDQSQPNDRSLGRSLAPPVGGEGSTPTWWL